MKYRYMQEKARNIVSALGTQRFEIPCTSDTSFLLSDYKSFAQKSMQDLKFQIPSGMKYR
jgi:hypothetical protein